MRYLVSCGSDVDSDDVPVESPCNLPAGHDGEHGNDDGHIW